MKWALLCCLCCLSGDSVPRSLVYRGTLSPAHLFVGGLCPPPQPAEPGWGPTPWFGAPAPNGAREGSVGSVRDQRSSCDFGRRRSLALLLLPNAVISSRHSGL